MDLRDEIALSKSANSLIKAVPINVHPPGMFFYILYELHSINNESKSMASGWGITGNKGRCYDFWMDFGECMSRCIELKDCYILREDYLECLHHSNEVFTHYLSVEIIICRGIHQFFYKDQYAAVELLRL